MDVGGNSDHSPVWESTLQYLARYIWKTRDQTYGIETTICPVVELRCYRQDIISKLNVNIEISKIKIRVYPTYFADIGSETTSSPTPSTSTTNDKSYFLIVFDVRFTFTLISL